MADDTNTTDDTTKTNSVDLVPTTPAYMEVLAQARTTLLSEIKQLVETASDDVARKDLKRLYKTVDPIKPGMEEMETRWSPPILRALQNMTRNKPDGAVAGDFYSPAGAIYKPPIKGVPLYIFGIHRMFPSGNTMGAPVCVAPDGAIGTTYGLCKDCINFPYGRNATRTFTDCDYVICALFLGENMRVYRIEFARTSQKAGLKLSSLMHEWDGISDQWVTFGTKEDTNPAGNQYHVITVSANGTETADHIRDAAECLTQMMTTERKALVTEHRHAQTQGETALGAVEEEDEEEAAEKEAAKDDNPDLTGKF